MKTAGDLKRLIKKIKKTEDVSLENEIGQQYRRHFKHVHQAAMHEYGHSLEELLTMPNRTELGELTSAFAEQLKDWADGTIFISNRCWHHCLV